MKNQELNNKIIKFCKDKNFENPFIQECIHEFIKGHIRLYGDVISTEDLFKRLEDNLDKITFAGRVKAPNVAASGEYKGRISDNVDLNEIFIYFDEADLELSDMDRKMWNIYTDSDKQKLLQELRTKKRRNKKYINTRVNSFSLYNKR